MAAPRKQPRFTADEVCDYFADSDSEKDYFSDSEEETSDQYGESESDEMDFFDSDSKRRTDSDMSDGDAESETEKSDAEIGETASDDGPVMRQNRNMSLETVSGFSILSETTIDFGMSRG